MKDETIYFLTCQVVEIHPEEMDRFETLYPTSERPAKTASLHSNVTNVPSCCATLLRKRSYSVIEAKQLRQRFQTIIRREDRKHY